MLLSIVEYGSLAGAMALPYADNCLVVIVNDFFEAENLFKNFFCLSVNQGGVLEVSDHLGIVNRVNNELIDELDSTVLVGVSYLVAFYQYIILT